MTNEPKYNLPPDAVSLESKFVELPLSGEETRRILEGRQVAFTFPLRYEAIQRSILHHENLPSALYQIWRVQRLTLNYVALHLFRENGYPSSSEFRARWTQKHGNWNPRDRVFIHYLRRVDVNA